MLANDVNVIETEPRTVMMARTDGTARSNIAR